MTIEEMKEKKRELGYSNEKIAELSGLPLGTVMKIFSGATRSPRRTTILALEKVFAPDSGYNSVTPYTGQPSPGFLMEPAPAYRKSGGFTLDDYYALPDDRRVELIDGTFYDMASPSLIHQSIILRLALLFTECEDAHNGACRVFISPCDVQLAEDDLHTMVQPDMIVVCDRKKLAGIRVIGAPDLCAEVMSPSSRSHDSIRKLNKYRKSGVREYWLIDPEERIIMVYIFENGTFQTYSFSDTIPVWISGGTCRIDFSRIEKLLSQYESD